jgi:hypothetical protein
MGIGVLNNQHCLPRRGGGARSELITKQECRWLWVRRRLKWRIFFDFVYNLPRDRSLLNPKKKYFVRHLDILSMDKVPYIKKIIFTLLFV